MKVYNQRTAYLKDDAIGIDDLNPRLTWKVTDGVTQTAYEIRFYKNGKLDSESGKVDSSSMFMVYTDKLESRDIIKWQVRVYDENHIVGPWSELTTFEMGLLSANEWKAKWVTGVDTNRDERLPADYYEKKFEVSKVTKARLYVTSHGVYEAYLNNEKIGKSVLSPGSTEYNKRLYYQTYDVTGLIKENKLNTINFIVGDGWFKGKVGYEGDEYVFGNQLKLLAQLEIYDQNGNVDYITSDENVRWSNDGQIRFSDLKDGMDIDFNFLPTYKNYAQVLDMSDVPVASNAPVITEHERFSPIVIKTEDNKMILDFGQNMAGYVVFNEKLGSNEQMTIRLGETLHNGEFTQENFKTLPDRGKSINQKLHFIGDGDSLCYYPKFFYAGFRFALVECTAEINPNDFEAIAIYTDIDYGSSFNSSNEKVNQFVKNTIWSEKSNFVDVPTDCPQREKAAWTGDAQVFLPTSLLLSTPPAFFKKWLKDMRDTQREDGRISNISPRIQNENPQEFMDGSVGWADAAVIIPYKLWKTYNDSTFITDNYDLMIKWRDYVIKTAADKSNYELTDDNEIKQFIEPYLIGESPYSKYIVEFGGHWGEWCEPADVVDVDMMTEILSPKIEENLAFMHYSMGLLTEMLEEIDAKEEAKLSAEYCEKAKEAYQYHFVKNDDIDTTRQSKLVRPLAFNLLSEKTHVNVAARLNQTAIQRDFKIGTGFLSTPFILPVLADNGYIDTAYKILENEEEPGWLAMVNQGATTVWERYNGYDDKGNPLSLSYNHYSPGAVCTFLFEYIVGIKQTAMQKFEFKPVINESMDYAEAVIESFYGKVFARWEKLSGSKLKYAIDVPSNTHGNVTLPNGKTFNVKSGYHEYIFDIK